MHKCGPPYTPLRTPTALYARSNATINVFNYGMMPLGALLGGLLAALLGVRGAMWATTGLLPLAGMFIVFSPLRRLRTLPGGPALSDEAHRRSAAPVKHVNIQACSGQYGHENGPPGSKQGGPSSNDPDPVKSQVTLPDI